MAQIFTSNSFDALVHLLDAHIDSHDGHSRLIVVVPNQLVKRYVQQFLLEKRGVIAGVQFVELSVALTLLFHHMLGSSPNMPPKNTLALRFEKILEESGAYSSYINGVQSRIPPLADALASYAIDYGKYGGDPLPEPFEVYLKTIDTPRRLRPAKPSVSYTVHLFGFQHLPRSYISLLSSGFDVFVYTLSPTSEYVGELDYPLDLSLCQNVMNGFADLELDPTPIYVKPEELVGLQEWQNALLQLSELPKCMDESISLHSATSLDRCIEVLYDTMENPDDVLILCSDIGRASPVFHRVFGNPDAPIPYSIYDAPQRKGSSFYSLLTLVEKRITFEELEIAIADHLEFEPGETHIIMRWLDAMHFRWGLHENHRKEFVPNVGNEGTLKDVLHRLAYSFMESGIVGVSTTELSTLERFYEVYSALSRLYNVLQREVISITEWQTEIHYFARSLFESSEHFAALQTLFEYVDTDEVFTPKALYRWTKKRFQPKTTVYNSSLLSGVIVAPLHPEYILPRRRIVCLGLDESSFPPEDPVDILGKTLREWKPSRSQEALGALTQAVACAGSELQLFYETIHYADGSPQTYSHVLESFLSLISCRKEYETSFLESPPPALPKGRALAVQGYYQQVSKSLFCEELTSKSLPEAELPETITIQDLTRVLKDPLKAHAQSALGIYFSFKQIASKEREFTLSALDRYILKQKLSEGHPLDEVTKGLPSGELKKPALHKLLEATNVKPLYIYLLRDDCKEKTRVSPQVYAIPPISCLGCTILGELTGIEGETLYIEGAPTIKSMFAHWAEILIFGQIHPNGTIEFLPSNKRFSAPTQGLDQLLSYASIAMKTPSIVTGETVESIHTRQAKVLKKKVLDMVNSFSHEDPYAELYVQHDFDENVLLSRWSNEARTLLEPMQRWIANGRV